MGAEETVYPNDVTMDIRRIMGEITKWSKDNDKCDPRHVAMLLTKLEEAELISLRITKNK